jgi:MoaA/NifB/PqqE/SkfB family radical SAM enzyme
MRAADFPTKIFPKTLAYRAARARLVRAPAPMTLTFSITNACQSRCKTCNIWRLYPDHLQDPRDELTIDEFERIFASIGPLYFFNFSGGEPFLRPDMPEIAELAVEYLKPAILHTPTNAIATDRVLGHTRRILEMLRARGLRTPFTVKPSLDGLGCQHDEIRGVEGNWEKLLATVEGLQGLEREFDNLHVEIGTVVSNFNKHNLDEIEDFVHGMGVQSYRNEIAEQREEFFNLGDPITPSAEEYGQLMREFAAKVRANMASKRPLARLTESLRLVYYDVAARTVKENRQVIPCYAGISNAHITPTGQVWPCCVLGYAKPLGELREADLDFWTVWRSPEADQVRRGVRAGECACPLANQAYSNIVCHTPSLMKAALNMVDLTRR